MMKKIISVLLLLSLILGLVACGSSGGEGTTAAAKDERFRVGYGREDITPTTPVGLTGYGNTSERLHKNVLDPLYLTCVATTDAEDNTVIMVVIDITGMDDASANTVRSKISKTTGVPKENITVSGTHTHSAPTFQNISSAIIKAAEKASVAAMEDRAYADMYMGQTNTVGLNFVRHYVMDDESVVGDNFGVADGKTYVGHTSEADTQMQVLQFKRDGKKDVLLVNWQSHPHITGGSNKYDLSADIVGAFRMEMEKQGDYLFAYFQGAAGNINPTSRINSENANQSSPRDYKVHGQLLAGHAKEALSNMKALEPGLIQVRYEDYVGECFHGDGELANYAPNVLAYYEAGHTIAETKTYAEQFGIHSLYHARSISNRSSNGATKNIPITTITMGSVGFATIPGELFDECGVYIKENSPYEMTFVMGYCNGAISYLPSKLAWGHGSYEVDISAFVLGTAEALAERHVEILKEMKGGQ